MKFFSTANVRLYQTYIVCPPSNEERPPFISKRPTGVLGMAQTPVHDITTPTLTALQKATTLPLLQPKKPPCPVASNLNAMLVHLLCILCLGGNGACSAHCWAMLLMKAV